MIIYTALAAKRQVGIHWIWHQHHHYFNKPIQLRDKMSYSKNSFNYWEIPFYMSMPSSADNSRGAPGHLQPSEFYRKWLWRQKDNTSSFLICMKLLPCKLLCKNTFRFGRDCDLNMVQAKRIKMWHDTVVITAVNERVSCSVLSERRRQTSSGETKSIKSFQPVILNQWT